MSLVLVGMSHHRLAGRGARADRARPRGRPRSSRPGWRRRRGGLLSTCNRTELYFVAPDPDAERRSRGRLRRASEVELYRMHDEDAALHLFRVAAGLDSLVPGEGEILGQVRARLRGRRAAARARPRSSGRRSTSGRRCGPQTAIAESPASVSSAAAALAQQVFGDLAGCKVLSSARARSASRPRAPPRARRDDLGGHEPHAGQRRAARRGLARGTVPFDALGPSSRRPTWSCPRRARPSRSLSAAEIPDAEGPSAVPDRPRRPARPRPRRHRARGLLPVRHRRPPGRCRARASRAAARGGARRGDRRAGGRAL